MRFILASGSPRRREILNSLGWTFEVVVPDTDESMIPGETPRGMALRLAAAKASAVRGEVLTIGADTVVDVDGTALGKPVDRGDARRMLKKLSGRTHMVHTGVAVARSGEILASGAETTDVTFGDLSDAEIAEFADSGDGDDKAGAYAIQGRGALLVRRIEGCYYNVVGMPVFMLKELLESIGYLDDRPQNSCTTGDDPQCPWIAKRTAKKG
jgi:septum formation protein